MILKDNHMSISTSGDVNQICKPFFDATGIKLFSYVRVYKSGEILSLTSNPEFQKYYYAQEFYKQPKAISTCIKSGNHLLSANPNLNSMLNDAKEYFSLDNMFEMVTNCGEFYETIRFAGNYQDNSVLDIYFNKQDVLTALKFYFLEKGKDIISKALAPGKLIDLSEYCNPKEINVNISLTALEHLKSSISRYYITNSNEYLTRRELECLLYFMKGLSSVEVSKILSISEKTVRSYLESMISKMGVENRSELIQHTIKLGFMNLLK